MKNIFLAIYSTVFAVSGLIMILSIVLIDLLKGQEGGIIPMIFYINYYVFIGSLCLGGVVVPYVLYKSWKKK
jgi:K+-transporting ATPase A subunit